MSPAVRMGLPEPPGFPRVSGDEPFNIAANHNHPMFSPRERG